MQTQLNHMILIKIFTLSQNGNKYAIDFIRDNNLEEAYNTGIIN